MEQPHPGKIEHTEQKCNIGIITYWKGRFLEIKYKYNSLKKLTEWIESKIAKDWEWIIELEHWVQELSQKA